jgi:Do/DeqQ family serine protease
LFQRFFGDRFSFGAPQERVQGSLGSGVIVRPNGVIVTNNHVIEGADEIQVALIDGRSYRAELLGSDPDLDIAVVQIEAEALFDIPIADSNQLEVGDFVVAIGNPFGLGQTVTTGVVSALGRSGLGIEGYENFIQTDASINPGNSGGALVNLNGELVGINTAIISPAGGNVGIGFAIPANMAAASMAQIIRHGEVRRGHLGVNIQDITPDLRRAFELENGQRGVLITDVVEGSPAAKAGLTAGDIIIEVNGQTTASGAQLRSQIGMKAIGEQVELKVLNNGKTRQLKVKIGKPEALVASRQPTHPLLDGVQLRNSPDGQGVQVANLAPNSRAAYSGLRPGDLIIAVNRQRVYNLESLQRALQKSPNSLLLQVNRHGSSLFIAIR